ncbi:MAG: hypothetical protein IT374_23490 [Polyangiaceae bacterium]|nr:hypothetical protein [Polyangiaceae bacterium]
MSARAALAVVTLGACGAVAPSAPAPPTSASATVDVAPAPMMPSAASATPAVSSGEAAEAAPRQPVSAAPSSSVPPPAGPPARTLRYQELFTGMLPYPGRLHVWQLELHPAGRFVLHTEDVAMTQGSLIEGRARRPVRRETLVHRSFSGTWGEAARGAVELRFEGEERPPIRCAWARVKTLSAGALMRPVGDAQGRWVPATRTSVEALGCDRSWLAPEATWSIEPQPVRLLFAPYPGLEYAHDNDDMVLQQGGVRRSPPDP